MTPRRRRLLPQTLAVAGGLLAASLPGTFAARSASATPPPVSTPLFSARRVPGLVLAEARGPALRTALAGVAAASPPDTCIQVSSAGKTLYAHRTRAPMTPASNLKLLTARLALDLLGPDHRYRTSVEGTAPVDGQVDGDLYLVGGGDPVLGTDAYLAHFHAPADRGTSLEQLADRVVAAGVRHVTGSVVGDETRYDSERAVSGWPERYLDQHQLGPLTALEVNQSFTSFPAKFSETTLDQLTAAPDPPQFAAATFTELLRKRGVRIDGVATTGVAPPGTSHIATIASPPLSDIVAEMLRRSDNQIAELLVKEVGKVKGSGGTTAAGLDVFRSELGRLGFTSRNVVLHDGSGLDHHDRVACAVLDRLLRNAGADSTIGRGLAVAGRSGTLSERFTMPAVRGRIRAKTGTLNDVTALSGFADTRHGPTLVFTYIANGAYVSPELLSHQDDLARALVGYAGDVRLSSLEPG